MQHWLRATRYEITRTLCSVAGMLTFSLRVEGGRHVPASGPVLLIANHECYLDPVFIGITSPRHLCYLARETLWRNKILGGFLSAMNTVPVDQVGFARAGILSVVELLGKNQAVLVFPEGERTMDSVMRPFKGGIHLILRKARRQNIHPKILPVGVAGAYDAWPRWRRFPKLSPFFWPAEKGTIAISIGRPMAPDRLAEMPAAEALQELFIEVRKQVERAERLRRKS